jgi:hypothetical protein
MALLIQRGSVLSPLTHRTGSHPTSRTVCRYTRPQNVIVSTSVDTFTEGFVTVSHTSLKQLSFLQVEVDGTDPSGWREVMVLLITLHRGILSRNIKVGEWFELLPLLCKLLAHLQALLYAH